MTFTYASFLALHTSQVTPRSRTSPQTPKNVSGFISLRHPFRFAFTSSNKLHLAHSIPNIFRLHNIPLTLIKHSFPPHASKQRRLPLLTTCSPLQHHLPRVPMIVANTVCRVTAMPTANASNLSSIYAHPKGSPLNVVILALTATPPSTATNLLGSVAKMVNTSWSLYPHCLNICKAYTTEMTASAANSAVKFGCTTAEQTLPRWALRMES